jgi:glycosyltransferase involved in cell wall biosynthesis
VPKPLVSILISAYNAEQSLAETLESAVGQSWPNKEIILVDDGSTDKTAAIARKFAARGVILISRENGGLSAGVNSAYEHCHGDYIQYLDADDLLVPDKIEVQLTALRDGESRRILLSSPWARFYHRTQRASFVRNSLWEDLTPVEWLLRKMSENLHMQNATWLVSRELAEAAGPWDTTLHYDQDGEYFARVLLASEGTQFVPGTGIYYRASGSGSISYLGNSKKKRESLFQSMRLHMRYLQSLEESERVRKTCLVYMQTWYGVFYPDQADTIAEMQSIAAELGGKLTEPGFPAKYGWLRTILGYRAARRAATVLPRLKSDALRHCDKLLYRLQANREGHALHPTL